MALQIRLFGAVELIRDDHRISLESGRVESLLAYLVLHRDAPQSREHLASLLWPDTPDSQARTNLRHLLHTLRRALPEAATLLEVTGRALQWRGDADVDSDVAAFDAALAQASVDDRDSVEALQRAVDLYRGELVPGHFDEWLLAERDAYASRFRQALHRLAAHAESNDDVAQALSLAERLVLADPLDESGAELLMRLHDSTGDRTRAVRVYHGLASTLERELGVAPSPALQQVYASLLMADDDTAAAATQLDVAPFVGRRAERGQLARQWRALEETGAVLVMVSGEAGIGKTRLIEEFRRWCVRSGGASAEARCYAAEGTLSYAPVAGWLRSAAGHAAVRRLDPARQVEITRLLPELSTEIADLAAPRHLPENEQRQALFDALATALRTVGRPFLLILDDAQWADRETMQFLHYLLRQAADDPVLIVLTSRAEDLEGGSPLDELLRGARALERIAELRLPRLSRTESDWLASRLASAEPGTVATEQLWSDTEGNPLFLVEAVRAGWHPTSTMTPRVQAVLDSRLAQLAPATRDLAGLAATIGRQFDVELLEVASGTPADALASPIDELWRRQLIRERDSSAYDFSHGKLREAAYAALSPIQRRRNHLRVASALAHGAQPDEAAAQIASHYERGGVPFEALTWYLRAADNALRLYANTEAVRLLDRAESVLHHLPASPERDLQELQLLARLPAPLASVEGYASPRLSAVQQRALRLAETSDREPAPPLLWSLAFSSLVREEFSAAEDFADRLRRSGERSGDDVQVVEGACLLGFAAFWRGDLERARAALTLTLDRYRADQRTAHLMQFGQDPAVLARARLANVLWFQGDTAGALEMRNSALASAAQVHHPLSSAAAVIFTALLAVDMGDRPGIRTSAAMLATLAHEAPQVAYFTDALTGYVAVLDGSPGTGLERIRTAIEGARLQPPAPGMSAILGRIRLAAAVAAQDATAVADAAEDLLLRERAAAVWAAEARHQQQVFAAAER